MPTYSTSTDFTERHHRPVGVDGDVGAVVVEDGAGAVDDFLVALDLRHDLLLHLQRRQRDLDRLNIDEMKVRDGARLRTYPNNPEALNAMRAQAKCRKAR